VRCGTSVGANYRACCKARSRAEFISKIGVVEEEINESVYWLELIVSALVLPTARVEPLLNEARELEKIFAASRITASRNR
jgi:four helix bundle protein